MYWFPSSCGTKDLAQSPHYATICLTMMFWCFELQLIRPVVFNLSGFADWWAGVRGDGVSGGWVHVCAHLHLREVWAHVPVARKNGATCARSPAVQANWAGHVCLPVISMAWYWMGHCSIVGHSLRVGDPRIKLQKPQIMVCKSQQLGLHST